MSNFKYLISPDEVYIDSAGNRFYIEAFLDPAEIRQALAEMSAVIASVARMEVEPKKPPQALTGLHLTAPMEIRVRWYPKEEEHGVANRGESTEPSNFHGGTG